MEKLQQVEQKFTGLINEMRSAQRLAEWMHSTGNIEGAEKKEFDDSGWKKVVIGWGVQWQASETNAWFRRKVVIPDKICGVSLEGAKLEGMFFIPVGGEIFIDGKKIIETDWLPDIIFPVKDNLKSGEEFLFAVRTKKGEGWGATFFSRIYIDKIDEAIFQLELFLNLLRLTQAIMKWKPALKKQYEKILNAVLEKIDIKALEEKNAQKLLISIIPAQKLFAGISKEAKKLTIHLIGHAHIDMNWLWTWQSTLYTAKGTFTTVDNLMNKVPDFCFSQSQAGLYQEIEKHFPEVFNLVKKRVKEKNWDVTASTWVEGDINTASGEALVRQTLYARKYIKERFGLEPRIAWCPDTFGHAWTYPQILKKSGIDFYFGHRCRPGNEYPLFWWEAPDGSRVLALVHGETYNYKITPELCAGFIRTKDRTGTNHYLVSHGVGDHGGGPTLRDLERVKRLQEVKEFPRIKFDSAENYYKEVLKEKKNFPVVKNELNFTFEGCYTTHGDIKMMNRTSENILQTAETLSTMYNSLGGKYPEPELEKAWQNTCFNQFHDIFCGSAIHPVYGDGEQHAKTLFDETIKIAGESIKMSLKEIAKKIDVQSKGIPVVVFNPFSWQRDDIVIIESGNFKNVALQELGIYDEKGNYISSQFNGSQIIFEANIPAMGYRVYYLRGENKNEEPIPVFEDVNSIRVESDLFSVRMDKNSGCLARLFDKRTSRDMIFSSGDVIDYAKPFPEPGNLFQIFYEKPHPMSAWTIGPISKIENILAGAKVEIKEKGPVRVVIKVTHRILESELSQDIVIYKGIPRVDFYTEVDWKEKGTPDTDAPMLKVSFPLSITQDKACFEIPFGYIYRKAHGGEVPQLRWMDCSGPISATADLPRARHRTGRDMYGLSLLNNAKHGCSVQGNTMKLTLIRSAYEPDPISDVGKHIFSYSLYPHKGDWRTGKTVQRGFEFNQPLLVYCRGSINRTPTLPESHSFLSIEPENLIISALKKAEDGKGIILRFYEAYGKATKGIIRLNIPIKSAVETDLMERNLPGKKLKVVQGTHPTGKGISPARIKISVGLHEIKTIRFGKNARILDKTKKMCYNNLETRDK